MNTCSVKVIQGTVEVAGVNEGEGEGTVEVTSGVNVARETAGEVAGAVEVTGEAADGGEG